jgi:hypothetical protein
VTYLLIPLIILGSIVVLFGLVVFLGRFRKGRYLRPIVAVLAKVPWIRRQFQKVSAATLERQNPELASAMRKLQRIGPNPDPQRAQQALGQLSVSERKAYFEAMEDQGGIPEPANRQQRRLQQKLQQGNRPGGGGTAKRGKRR